MDDTIRSTSLNTVKQPYKFLLPVYILFTRRCVEKKKKNNNHYTVSQTTKGGFYFLLPHKRLVDNLNSETICKNANFGDTTTVTIDI